MHKEAEGPEPGADKGFRNNLSVLYLRGPDHPYFGSGIGIRKGHHHIEFLDRTARDIYISFLDEIIPELTVDIYCYILTGVKEKIFIILYIRRQC